MPALGSLRWVFWAWRRWARHSAWCTRGWQWRLEHALIFPDDPKAPQWARSRQRQDVLDNAAEVRDGAAGGSCQAVG